MNAYKANILALLVTLICALSQGQESNSAAASAIPPNAAVKPPAREHFHIYLLMGQSNMAGRDTRNLAEQVANPRVLALNQNGQWVIARDPLFPPQGRVKPGTGPGITFAREMLKADTNITIGLVPCAVGGSALSHWVKGADYYEHTLKLARLAAQAGVIKGVLWHQGESDSTSQRNAGTYEARLTQMFKDLRADLGEPRLPVVVGQLGGFLPPEKYPYADVVRGAISSVGTNLENVGYADSTGLEDRGDQLHFSAAAAMELGRRFAKAMEPLQSVENAGLEMAAAIIDVWPAGKMPGHGAPEPEATRMPEKTDAKRITNISRPTLAFFPVSRKDAPAMIVCPGGGYSYVVLDKEGTEIATWLNSNGISALVLKYRTPNNRAGALQDVQRALSLTRAHAYEWSIDPRQIGIIGFSAGGNLAAKASTLFAERAYPAIDAADQQSCRPDFAVLVYPAYLDGKNSRVSADLNLKAKIPPTLIVHSEDDKAYAPGSKLYDAALTQAGIPHQFLFYPTGGHGYGLHCTKDAKAWPAAAVAWLHQINVQ